MYCGIGVVTTSNLESARLERVGTIGFLEQIAPKLCIFEDKLHSFDILKLPIFTSFLPKYPILVSTNTP